MDPIHERQLSSRSAGPSHTLEQTDVQSGNVHEPQYGGLSFVSVALVKPLSLIVAAFNCFLSELLTACCSAAYAGRSYCWDIRTCGHVPHGHYQDTHAGLRPSWPEGKAPDSLQECLNLCLACLVAQESLWSLLDMCMLYCSCEDQLYHAQ